MFGRNDLFFRNDFRSRQFSPLRLKSNLREEYGDSNYPIIEG